mgnify:CR=1 FL=1
METEGKQILVDYLTDIADTFRSITGETDTISAGNFSKEVQTVAASSSKNSYQRRSVEEMNAITDMKEGDTCLCYYNDSFNIIKDTKVGIITFPEEVTFKNAITDSYFADIRATDSDVDLFGMIDLNPSNFGFQVDKMDDQSRVGAYYSSEDGITYKLNQSPDVEGNFELIDERTVDFKMNIVVENTNKYIGAFLIGTVQTFNGLYEYDESWKTLGLNYSLDEYNVEASKIYYNNGEQEGMLGDTKTMKGIQKLNDFIVRYGKDFEYPEDMSYCFAHCKIFDRRIPLLELNPNTGNVTNMSYMLSGNINLTEIPLLDTSNVTDMSFLFQDCNDLKIVPLLNTSNVVNMKGMLQNCLSLETVPLLDTSKVTEMDYLFEGDRLLTEIPLFNTSNVTRMTYLFSNCNNLASIPVLDTSNVTTMMRMFMACKSLKTIPLLDTSNVTTMMGMFDNCSSLETIPMLNTSKVKEMYEMFYLCKSLKQIPMLDTKNNTSMTRMFSGCSSIVEIPELDTSGVVSMNGTFEGCSSLTTVPMIDASKVEGVYDIFKGCSSLTTMGGLKNLGMSYATRWDGNYKYLTLNLSDSPLLTHDSLMNVINNLYDIKSIGVKPQTLQLGDTNKAKLTAEEIAIATNKGWNVK